MEYTQFLYESHLFLTRIKIKNTNYVFEPFNMSNIFFIDFAKLKKYVKTDVDANKEYYDNCNLTYIISNPKKAEWIMSKAISNSKIISAGNSKFDIILDMNNINIYIDVGVLTLNKNYTNEKSIIQNFSDSNNLDQLFINKKGEEAINIFRNKLNEKYMSLNNNNIYYYLLFVCHKTNVYLTCLKLNTIHLSNIKFKSFVNETNDKDLKNITVDNFIAEANGNVKLYKSKKRLELRLHKSIIDKKCSIQIY